MNRFFVRVIFLLCMGVFPFLAEGGEEIDLFDKGNAAFSASDYVTSIYYFTRILESEGWKTFPQKIDVLRKLAMIEESQAQFEHAAVHYQQLIDLLPDATDVQSLTLTNFYRQRYAENLQRIGSYEQAGDILWNVVRQSDPANRQNVLDLLIDNYSNRKITDERIDLLSKQVLPVYLDSLGWKFAELLNTQGRIQQSLDLFEKLWPSNPVRACEFTGTIASVFSSVGQLDDLLARIHSKANENKDLSSEFILLETTLLGEAGRGEDALKQLEEFVIGIVGEQFPGDIEKILTLLPGPMVDQWIDLIARYRNSQSAIQLLEGILEKIPMDLNRQRRLADLLVKEGRKNEAVDLWSRWAKSQPNTPTVVLNAAQEIYTLGDEKSARDLIEQLKETIPPPLAWRQGQISLQFGDFHGAYTAFQNAVTSGGIPPSMITSVIQQYAQTIPNHDKLVASLIDEATGRPFSSLPEWIRTPLLQYGIQPKYREPLQSVADADTQGVWKYNIACEAILQGDMEWALPLLNSIAADSLYRGLADQKRAEILGQNPSMIAQREAADLMKPSIDDILSCTDAISSSSDAIISSSNPIQLNSVMFDRLLDYIDLRLNAYQPNEALLAIRIVESASRAVEQPFSESVQARIIYARGRTFAELASFGPAIDYLQSVTDSLYEEDAQFLLARIDIAQGKTEEAANRLNEIAGKPDYWRRTNDALLLLSVLDPLVGDSLQLFCDAMMYEIQGRYESAIPVLRRLAVEQYGEDAEEWTRYYIGRLKNESGDSTAAREEWERLLVEVDNPIIQGMTRLDLLQLGSASAASIADTTAYQDIMTQLPNTIFSDMTRLQMQRKFSKEQP